jgi:hypothetical protein
MNYKREDGTFMKIVCFECKKEISIEDKIGFRQDCSECGHDLHSCVQCQHYDPKVYNECKETMADRILEKTKANYCEFFTAQPSGPNLASPDQKKVDLLAQAEALFKKK